MVGLAHLVRFREWNHAPALLTKGSGSGRVCGRTRHRPGPVGAGSTAVACDLPYVAHATAASWPSAPAPGLLWTKMSHAWLHGILMDLDQVGVCLVPQLWITVLLLPLPSAVLGAWGLPPGSE